MNILMEDIPYNLHTMADIVGKEDFLYDVPNMGNNLTEKVRCRVDSGNC
ncbi:hypothetical protein [Terrisporobacter petrolearius]